MGAAESKTATLRLATEHLVEAESNVDGPLKELELKNQIKDVQEETEENVRQIKAKDIDEAEIKAEAKVRLESVKKANARDRIVQIQSAENEIEQAKLNLEDTEQEQAERIKSAELQISKIKREAASSVAQKKTKVKSLTDGLNQVIEIAKEAEERANLKVEQENKKTLNSIKDHEKAKKLQIDTAKAEGDKKVKALERKLEVVQLQNKAAGSGKKVLVERLYKDVLTLGLAQAKGEGK